MKHYILDTYHGPLVISQRQHDWIISSPFRPPEVFDGTIPPDCLVNARQASTTEVSDLLGDCAEPLWYKNNAEPHSNVIAIAS